MVAPRADEDAKLQTPRQLITCARRSRDDVSDRLLTAMTKPFQLTATEARHLIVAKELSPVELLDSCIGRIEAVHPAINAIVTTAFDRARQEAHAAERAVLRGDALGPLHGLPVAIKDNQETEG